MSTAKFNFSKDFQIKVLGLMLQEFDFLLLSHDIVFPQYFADNVLSWFFETMRDYYLNYQMRIDDVVLKNELKKASASGQIKSSEVSSYLEVYKQIKQKVDNKKYITEELTTFCRHQSLKKAVLEIPPLLSKNSFDEIESLLRDALQVGLATHDMGDQYFISWPERLAARINRQEQKIIPTGITELDTLLGGGIKARQLGIWMAPTSRGKSVGLVHCGKRAVIVKKKVIHYSLELCESEIAERYDSSFSRIKVRDLVDDEAKLASCLDHLGKTFGNTLLIKYYPMHTVSLTTIRAHALRCIAAGFVPDLILLDYLDLLKPVHRRKEKREELTEMTTGTRGLAGELDVPIWTATQSRRAAYSKETHDEEDTSEDLGKAMHADILITLNQTPKEAKDNTMRLFLAKNRNGPRSRTVAVKTDMERMCFYDPTTEFDSNNQPINILPTFPKKPPPIRKKPPISRKPNPKAPTT